MDVDVIEPGADFVSILDEYVSACSVLLAVIGAGWLDASDEKNRRRLEDPIDFVRLEILAALKRGITIIPVLVDGAAMPRLGDLPDVLQPLAHRHALEVRHDHFGGDVQLLTDAISRVINDAVMNSGPPPIPYQPIVGPESEELSLTRLVRRIMVAAFAILVLFLHMDAFKVTELSTERPGIQLAISFGRLASFWQLMNILLLMRMSFIAWVSDSKFSNALGFALILALGVYFSSRLLLLNLVVAAVCSLIIAFLWKEYQSGTD